MDWKASAILTILGSFVVQVSEALGLALVIIHLVCTIINTLVPLIKKIGKDGKITSDEIVEITEAVDDLATEIEEVVEDIKDGNSGESN